MFVENTDYGKTAISGNIKSPDAWINKGKEFYQLGRYENAIQYFDKAIQCLDKDAKICPEYVAAWFNKGVAFCKLGKHDESIQCFDKAIEVRPEYADAWHNKGLALYELHQHEDSIQCFDKAIEIHPEHADAWFDKSQALGKLGKRDEAIQCSLKWTEIKQRNSQATYRSPEELRELIVNEELSQKQKEPLDKFLNEQINEIFRTEKTVQYEDIKDDIEWLYQTVGIKQNPVILIFDSLLEAQCAMNYCAIINLVISGQLEHGHVRDQVWGQIPDRIPEDVERHFWDKYSDSRYWYQDKSRVWAQIESRILDRIWVGPSSTAEAMVWCKASKQLQDQVDSKVWGKVYSHVHSQILDSIPDPTDIPIAKHVRNQTRYRYEQDGDISLYYSWLRILGQVENQFWNKVDSNVWDLVISQVNSKIDSLGNDVINQAIKFRKQIGSHGLTWFPHHIGLIHESEWLIVSEQLRKSGFVHSNDFNRYRSFLYKGIFTIMFLDNFAVIVRTPKKVKIKNKELHSLTGPAFEWQNGDDHYYIEGTSFSKQLWEKIKDQSMNVDEILKIENQERKMIALKYYGTENLIRDCNANLIDISKRGNELYKITSLIPGRSLKLLKYYYIDKLENRKDYVDWVLDKFEKADAAMAWKHNMTEDEYALLRVEA